MDCCQDRLRGAVVSLDGNELGTIPQVDGTQKYTIQVKKDGEFDKTSLMGFLNVKKYIKMLLYF